MIKKYGKHTVMHGDIMQSNFDNLLPGKVDLFYSDPPWGAKNLKYWQTMNVKQTGADRNDIDLDAFVNRVFQIASTYVKDYVFVEYGVSWRNYLIERAKKYGFKPIAIIPLLYRSGKKMLPLDLHVFHKDSVFISQNFIDSVANTSGQKTVIRALYPVSGEGKTVLDPACGFGMTAQVAIETGMIFYGNELNYERLKRTMKRLNNESVSSK